jgi:hypothetical protein
MAAGYEQLRDDDAELLYQHAPVGYLTVAPDRSSSRSTRLSCAGRVIHDDLIDRRHFPDYYSDGKEYYESQLVHCSTVRAVRGSRSTCVRLPRARSVLGTQPGTPRGRLARLIRLAVMDATERREYEHELNCWPATEPRRRGSRRPRPHAQHTLPPALPSIPGLVGRYRPAGDSSQIGGDFTTFQ